jgi:hypothetical protein
MDGQFIPLAQACKLVPGHAVKPISLWRWSAKGVLAPNGKRVFLKVAKCGRTRATKAEWLAEFFEAAGQTSPVHGANA